jgi:carbamoyl-phosphate synthase large subunit
VEHNPVIINYIREVIEKLKPSGPCNVQLRYKNGKCYIFEFNARCSGTSAARAIAGFNEPLWICLGIEKDIYEPLDFREMAIFRYWKEFAVELNNVEKLRNERQITMDSVSEL